MADEVLEQKKRINQNVDQKIIVFLTLLQKRKAKSDIQISRKQITQKAKLVTYFKNPVLIPIPIPIQYRYRPIDRR